MFGFVRQAEIDACREASRKASQVEKALRATMPVIELSPAGDVVRERMNNSLQCH